MKRVVKFVLPVILFVGAVSYANAQKIIVATFNLRFDNPSDTGNLWVNRKQAATGLIRFHQFDLFGTQEGLLNQLNDINAALPEYSRYGAGRDDGKDAGEHSAIFYKTDRFKLLDKGDFWLSQTPGKPSLGWDATCCNRICTWVYLQDKQSGKKFWYFNVHYDHQGVVAREESSKLILQKINTIAGNGMVLLSGDFNGDYTTVCYQRIANSGILKDTHDKAMHPYDNNTSFNDFGKQLQDKDIIDHIFTTKQFSVKRWGILTDSYHGKYPSDHFPVMAELSY